MTPWLIAFIILLALCAAFVLGWWTRHYFGPWFDMPNAYEIGTIRRDATPVEEFPSTGEWVERNYRGKA